MENAASVNRSRLGWKWAVFIVFISAFAGAGAFVTHRLLEARNLARVSGVMKQLHAAFELYAEANAGNYYPLRSAEPEKFLPDMETWAAVGAGKAAFDAAYETLGEDEARLLCYLSYAFYDEASAHRVLDQLEKDPQAYRGGGTRLEKEQPLDPYSPEFDELCPLRTGVGQRFLRAWYVLSGPGPGGPGSDHPIPVLWQMPQKKGDRVTVLWKSGYVTNTEYPGSFPMSPLFINRVRGLMGLAQDPDFPLDTPILPIVRELLEAGSREPGPRAGSLLHFDTEPTVPTANSKGYRIELTHAELVLFPEGSRTETIAANTLFEPVKGEYYGLPRRLAIRYMGASRGYQWFGKMDYGAHVLLQESFGLTGGDGLYDAAVSYWIEGLPAQFWLQPHRKAQRKPITILALPDSLVAYVNAFIIARKADRTPVRQELIHAAAILCGSDYQGYGVPARPTSELVAEAEERFVAAAAHDAEAAATLALPHIFPHPGKGARAGATTDKIEFLRRLPEDAVLSTLRHLAENLQDSHEAGLCRELLEELD